ncbi:MAG: HPr family phosphocarrier protein [Oscillospiraceae bacterium]|jgi:phosphotransferase system HPr (HPr) family protein|nr:HPr family phosphocarrier protein [Oscillospiraceae bacterium]
MKRHQIDLGGLEGFNARSAALLAQLSSKFDSRILIEQGSKVVNAKSLMGVLSLSSKNSDSLFLVLDGEDEDEAYAALTEMIRARFTSPPEQACV